METEESYQVRLEVFEGPLDLLLFLIKKKKIDIHDIPIAVITREYLEYLNHKEKINLDREAEFLLIAALLIYLKSQMLLPREQMVQEDEEDPRQALIDHLLDYQRIKAASVLLREKEDEQSQVWKRTALSAPLPEEDIGLIEVSLFDLAESFFTLMKRKEVEDFKVIKGKEVSLTQKTNEILDILRERTFLDFLEYLSQQESLEEAMISFFCLLELIKARLVIAIQEQLFHTIKVWLRKDAKAKIRP
ncbi:MAG: segregation/condensation protein A [Candidatus Aminicenantales bacterium]